jgi:tetratricopeptide (TPR) repeat protein
LLAQAVFLALQERGCDVFMDTLDLKLERIDLIEHQIAARAHFLVLLTPDSVIKDDNMSYPWIYRQIHWALKMKRYIMPIMAYGFTFKNAQPYLLGDFARLRRFNSITLPLDQFDEVMDQQAKRFVRQSTSGKIQPTPREDEPQIQQMIERIRKQPVPTQDQLTAEQFLNQGMVCRNQGDLAGAMLSYAEALCLHPKYPEAYFYRAVVHTEQNNLAAAITDYTAAIRIAPEYLDVYRNRGLLYQKQGKWTAALADFSEAIRVDPDYVLPYLNRAFVHYKRGNWDEAIINYNEVLRIEPQNDSAYILRALVYQSQGDLEKAAADLTEAIRLRPRDCEAYNNRGVIYEKQGYYWKAFIDFNSALRKNPKSSLAKSNRSKVLKKMIKRWGR